MAGCGGDPAPPIRALTIAGTHSGGGAGIEADLRTFRALGAHGMTAITAVNAQNTLGFVAGHPIPPEHVVAQMDAVLADIGVDCAKTGQLASGATVRAVADRLERARVPVLVVDPVLLSTSGAVLLDEPAALVRHLFPLATVVTPNWPEAERLLGRPITDPREACRALPARAVVLKGGHRPGPPIDLLYDGQGFVEYPGERIPGPGASGTGCVFSAALAVYLARGLGLIEAVGRAKALTAAAIRRALPLGRGRRPPHPEEE